MLARLLFAAAFLGFCLAAPTGIVLAEDDAETTVAPQTPDEPHPPYPGWDDESRPPGPRGMQPPPPRMRDRMPRPRVKDAQRKDRPRRDDKRRGPGMGKPGMPPEMMHGRRDKPGKCMPTEIEFERGIERDNVCLWARTRYANMTKISDPEMYELLEKDRDLEHLSMQLSMQFRRAQGDAKAEILKQLEETVTQHFEVRQQRRRLEVERFEKQLQSLREAIERREEVRKEIIQRRIIRLTGQKDPLEF